MYLQIFILIANNGDPVIVRKWCSHEITCSRHFTRGGGGESDSKKILQIRIWFSKCSWHLFLLLYILTCYLRVQFYIYISLVTMKRENWCFKSDNCSAWSILIKLLIGYVVKVWYLREIDFQWKEEKNSISNFPAFYLVTL